MKVRQLGLIVTVIVVLVIAFLVARHLRFTATNNPTDKTVTISASSQAGCQVDNAKVTLDPKINHIEWASTDKPYWVSFLTLRETPPNGYVPESPLIPKGDPVPVPANGSSGKFNVKADPNHGDPNQDDYYMYAIYDHNPATSQNDPCKKASDDGDTGVIVKR